MPNTGCSHPLSVHFPLDASYALQPYYLGWALRWTCSTWIPQASLSAQEQAKEITLKEDWLAEETACRAVSRVSLLGSYAES